MPSSSAELCIPHGLHPELVPGQTAPYLPCDLCHFRLSKPLPFQSAREQEPPVPCKLKRCKELWGKVKWKSLSRVWLFVTPRTVAHQAPLSVRFPRQEDWSGLPFPPPGDLLHPGTVCPAHSHPLPGAAVWNRTVTLAPRELGDWLRGRGTRGWLTTMGSGNHRVAITEMEPFQLAPNDVTPAPANLLCFSKAHGVGRSPGLTLWSQLCDSAPLLSGEGRKQWNHEGTGWGVPWALFSPGGIPSRWHYPQLPLLCPNMQGVCGVQKVTKRWAKMGGLANSSHCVQSQLSNHLILEAFHESLGLPQTRGHLGHVTVMAGLPRSSLPNTRCQLQERKRQGVLWNPGSCPSHVWVTPDIQKSTVDRKQEKCTGKGLPSPSRGLFLGIGLSSRGTEMFRNDSFFLTCLLVAALQRVCRKRRAWASRHWRDRQVVLGDGNWEFGWVPPRARGLDMLLASPSLEPKRRPRQAHWENWCERTPLCCKELGLTIQPVNI